MKITLFSIILLFSINGFAVNWKKLSENKSGSSFYVDVENIKTRYVKVVAKNLSKAPIWHHGADLPSWIFADEIIIR